VIFDDDLLPQTFFFTRNLDCFTKEVRNDRFDVLMNPHFQASSVIARNEAI